MATASTAALGAVALPSALAAFAPRTLPQAAADVDVITHIPIGAPVAPPLSADYVGVTFGNAATKPARVRFIANGTQSEWHHLAPSSHCPDTHPVGLSTDLLLIPDGCSSVEVAHDDPSTQPSAVAINGRVRSLTGVPNSTTRFLSIPVVTRSGWGAQTPAGGNTWRRSFRRPQMITVHHSATALWSSPAATVRAIYRYHATTLGWGDVGYHLLIDPAGTIYAGRDTGNDQSPVFRQPPSGNGTAELVTAGHAYALNGGNIGICLLGDFSTSRPSRAAQTSLIRVLAALCAALGFDPTATVNYTEPDTGARYRVPIIAQHRDLNDTSCPGAGATAAFAALRSTVAARMSAVTAGLDAGLNEESGIDQITLAE
ncbi:hypothetical protein GCM10011410_26410 [Hoyosella rhizosphaerae]|uniref:N-acetylmuramoyl-L-alanine amidase n=1 Tax=Hoyosella rhizosphaerae TaxID=1755582 RepID=A0A916XHC2_9ACTN|nr:hypothetical protein GCM10011410_26410 [Hoyosella rhizosphaerae]